MHFRGVIKNWFYGSCPGFAGAFPYFGTKVFFPKKSLIFEIACRDRIYEYANLQVLRHLITPESTYFDIGANIGLMSVPILHSHPNSRVVSFEASPKTLDYLYKTHQHSQYRDRWKIIGKAAGTQSGILEFYSSKRAGLDAMNGRKDTHRAAEMESIRVPSTTIDAEWIALNRPNVRYQARHRRR